jgi:hypothetical protein
LEFLSVLPWHLQPQQHHQVKSDRGAYTFSYATLDSLHDAVCLGLSTNGLAILCSVAVEDGVVTVTNRLAHKRGQWG